MYTNERNFFSCLVAYLSAPCTQPKVLAPAVYSWITREMMYLTEKKLEHRCAIVTTSEKRLVYKSPCKSQFPPPPLFSRELFECLLAASKYPAFSSAPSKDVILKRYWRRLVLSRFHDVHYVTIEVIDPYSNHSILPSN